MSSIKAIFPTGVTEVTVHGLHQWDYGRSLEITLPHRDVSNQIGRDIHFAQDGDKEAMRASCNFNDAGVATVAIPDELLEKARPITVWVYEYTNGHGETLGTIILPVKARVMPPQQSYLPG